ncbi:MAG: SusC/RagA family TonB-linked outer membrane protein [Bacteroidales bacterium]|nr:SusC/RagA family TonB-linked outer membrane protein [Bacteroidales bacterium]
MYVSKKITVWCMRFALSVLAMVLLSGTLMAQNIRVSGKVTDKANLPSIGVSVMVEGTRTGVATELDGTYNISAPGNATLVFSAIGMQTQRIPVNNRATINVVMEEDALLLDDVVVTALGIRKERKALGYAVQDIKSDEILKNKTSNVLNSLSGKIAGVNVTQTSGSAGAGAQIIIRGGTSLERDNQPLFVVDGIIYDNSTPIGGNSGFDGATRGGTTNSNRIMDINPEDIENMSVLKGPAATALYGSRAATGVIVITTKKGQEGSMKVNFSSKLSSSWVTRMPEQQDMYKRGMYNQVGIFTDFTTQSWGDKFGSGDKMYNNIEDFFKTGIVYDNSVNISGGSKNSSFFLSASNYDQEGIIPETGFNKSTFRFNGEQKFGKLSVGANVAYSQATTNKTLTSSGLWSGGGNGAMTAVYGWSRSDDMKTYLKPDGSKYRMFEGLQPLADDVENPYWIVNKNKMYDITKRLTGSINANLKVTDWFDVVYRAGIDTYNKFDYTLIAPNGAVRETYQKGRLSNATIDYQYLSSNLMLTFNKKIADFDLNLLLGQSIEETTMKNDGMHGYNFITPGFYSFGNINNADKFLQSTLSEKRLMGVFGEFRASYKSIAYLTVTGRNDWTSTLPVDNRSYFYPSVGGSLVFSELLPKNNILSFGKVRGSWARVGKDTDPYATSTTLWAPRMFLAGTGVGNSWTRGNPYLMPEITESIEAGLEARFLNGRFGFDLTYYQTESKNQITTPRLGQSTGYILLSVNVGSVMNKGLELSLNAIPVQTKDFTWDVTVNLAGNRGTVSNLLTGQDVLYVTDVQYGNAKAASFNNGKFFGISGSTWRRDDAGNVILDWNTGMPLSDNLTTKFVGNREPSFTGGINNSFTYKNFNLSFLLDVRVGGDIFNGTDYYMTMLGMSKRSMDRESLTLNGVSLNPATQALEAKSVTYQANQSYTISGVQQYGADLIRRYWATTFPLETANYITKTNWLRLRSVHVSYNVPQDVLKKQNFIKGLAFTLQGTNLWLLTNYKGMDPETGVAGSGVIGSSSAGIDYAGVPATAGVSFGINLTF